MKELAYSDEQVSYTDEDTKDYNTTYYYYVAFQPNEWNTSIMKPEDATNLYKSTYTSISTSNPLKSILASNNLDNKITVTCSFYSFENATSSNPYKLLVYRRAKVLRIGEKSSMRQLLVTRTSQVIPLMIPKLPMLA